MKSPVSVIFSFFLMKAAPAAVSSLFPIYLFEGVSLFEPALPLKNPKP